MKLLLRYFFLLMLSNLLIGCSPVKLPEIHTYMIDGVPTHIIKKKHASGVILVNLPETVPVYNTTKIAYSTYPYQIAYFTKNQWASTPAQMLLPLLVETLQNTHAFKAVVTAPFPGNYQYVLNTKILDLRQDFSQRPAVVKFSIEAMLAKQMGTRVIASKRFHAVLTMPCVNTYRGIVLMNQASEILLKKIAAFSVRNQGR